MYFYFLNKKLAIQFGFLLEYLWRTNKLQWAVPYRGLLSIRFEFKGLNNILEYSKPLLSSDKLWDDAN